VYWEAIPNTTAPATCYTPHNMAATRISDMPLRTGTLNTAYSRRAALCLLALLLSYCPCGSSETYYRWQDAQGNHHYSDARPADAIALQTLQLKSTQPLYEVEKVIDGDTIIVKNGGKVRLLGINAPEIAHYEQATEPYGQEAHRRLQELLSHKRVYLEFDQRRRDRYGRLLAHVTREDGTPVNAILLQEGLARALFLQPNMQHLQRYYAIESAAQRAKRGIWSLADYRVRPAQQATECTKRFCRLQGEVTKIEKGRHTTYLTLSGKVQLAIHHEYLPQFQAAGVDIARLEGRHLTVRGWVGERSGNPYLRLEHPYQIEGTAMR
jgi:micrococcal nuclease